MALQVYQEMGICLGPDYVGKGLGKEIVQGLIEHCRQEFGAKEFLYSTRDENEASNRLARSLGFSLVSSEGKTDSRDGHPYHLWTYRITI